MGDATAESPSTPVPRAQGSHDIYTRHVLTPTGIDFAQAAALYGLSHERADDVRAFRAALERALEHEGSSIIEVRGERADNVELHRRVWEGVSGALSRPAGAAGPTA